MEEINFGILFTIGATPENDSFKLADVDKFFSQTLPAVAGQVNRGRNKIWKN